jgi:DNA helicase-2/ATP-dependent DNA helicase PcrA
MHGAKGLSADVVFVLQAEDEILPGDTAGIEYEEARRLLYVSLTRARRKLFVGACRQRIDNQEWVRDKRIRRRTLTRFLEGYGLAAQAAAEYLAGD